MLGSTTVRWFLIFAVLGGCSALIAVIASILPDEVKTAARDEQPLFPYLIEKDGLAVIALNWTQRDSLQTIDHTVVVRNVGSSTIDGASMAFEFVYSDGSTSGRREFHLPVCRICDKRELRPGEEHRGKGIASVPQSMSKKIITDVELLIESVV